MKPRATPLPPFPSRLPYLRAAVPAGVFTFCLPTPGQAHAALEKYGNQAPGDALSLEISSGAMIRLCWSDEKYELEGDSDHAVFIELWKAGWAYSDIIGLAGALGEKAASAFAASSEVEERKDFFSVAGESTGTGCTSDSPICTTRGDGSDSPARSK